MFADLEITGNHKICGSQNMEQEFTQSAYLHQGHQQSSAFSFSPIKIQTFKRNQCKETSKLIYH